jgi:hypothetical protein
MDPIIPLAPDGDPDHDDGASDGTPVLNSLSIQGSMTYAATKNIRRLPRGLELHMLHVSREENTERLSIEMQSDVEQLRLDHVLSTQFLEELLAIQCPVPSSYISTVPSSFARRFGELSQSQAHFDALRAEQAQFFREVKASSERLTLICSANKQGVTLEQAIGICDARKQQIDFQEETIRTLTLENRGMKDLLNRKLLRTRVENDALRCQVTTAIEQACVNLADFKTSMCERIDAAVLSFHKPTYQTALRDLHAMSEALQVKVHLQAQDLKKIIATISMTDPVEAQGVNCDRNGGPETMHSALPEFVRDDLSKLSKEQLLNLLDIVSFEGGATDTIGRVVGVHKASLYQGTVFGN